VGVGAGQGYLLFPASPLKKGGSMECKHQYYHYVDGVLRCTRCDKTSEEIKKPQIEDKLGERTEVKRIVPRDVKKLGRPKKRR